MRQLGVLVPQAHAGGASVMQPLRAPVPGAAPAAIGSDAFEALAEADVAPETAFMHRFASLRAAAGGGKKKGKKKAKGDEEGLLDSDAESDSGSDAEIGAPCCRFLLNSQVKLAGCAGTHEAYLNIH